MKTFVKFGNYSLAICLIIVAALLAYVAIPTFGNKALIVRSGSMEPTIRTGDLIVVKIAKGVISPVPNAVSKYEEGDVIAFRGDKDPSVLTTHRIVSKKQEAGKTLYQTQGDANQTPDSQLVTEEQIVGKSGLTIPKAGKIFAFAKTKNGFALLVLFPALLVIALESSTLIKEIIKVARARRMLLSDPESVVEKNKLFGPVGLRVLMPFVVGLMFFHNTYAFFSDSAASLNNTFTAATSFCEPTTQGGPFYASSVISSNQLLRKNGTAVLPERSDPSTVLGAPNGIGSPASGFYALGYGGIIVVSFSSPVADVLGTDLSFHEITNGRSTYPLEKATVDVSSNGLNWFVLTPEISSEPAGDGVVYLDISSNISAPSTINFVRITDTSNPAINSDANSDAYDVDAIDATSLCIPNPSPTPEASSSATPTPSPEVESAPSPTPEASTEANLKINEFVANPETLFRTEWVEIFNAGANTVNLTGWFVQDNTSATHSLAGLGSIPSGGYVSLDIDEGFLNNSSSGDTIYLKNPSSIVIDSHTYGTAQADDKSRGRDVDGTGAFKSCTTPTKGTSNNGSC